MDANQEVFRRVVEEVFNRSHYQVMPDLFEPDFVEHQFGLKDTIPGMQSDVEGLHASFPDFNLTIEDIVSSGDMVWARMTGRGTNTGGMFGPPNGKKFEITVFDQVRVRNGKVVEHWGSPDRFAMMAQLGMLPRG